MASGQTPALSRPYPTLLLANKMENVSTSRASAGCFFDVSLVQANFISDDF